MSNDLECRPEYASASVSYRVGLVSVLYIGERVRFCPVTLCERILEVLHCFSVNHLYIQLVLFNYCFDKELLFQLFNIKVLYRY